MKRIKLFEAFNNTEKIDKLNSIVFSWAIESFIRRNDLVTKKVSSLPNTQVHRFPIVKKKLLIDRKIIKEWLYFTYSPNHRVEIYCTKELLAYLKKMKLAKGVNKRALTPYQHYDSLYFNEIVAKISKQAIKKIFFDDKD